jgi:hypothetical protein
VCRPCALKRWWSSPVSSVVTIPLRWQPSRPRVTDEPVSLGLLALIDLVTEGTGVAGELLAGRIAVMPLNSPISEEAQDAS